MLRDVHPLDADKLRRLGERLRDFSCGRIVRRGEIVSLVAELMVCVGQHCSADGAEIVADRLIALADSRLAAGDLADDALAEIRLNEAMQT